MIENVVHTSCQNSMLLFSNALIFYIMNIQNNQSHEFEWKPMSAPLRTVNDSRHSWLCNVFLKSFQDWLNSVQQHCNTLKQRNTGQEMFISWQTYERLTISVNSVIEAAQFFLWNQVKYVLLKRFCQDSPENWFGRQRSLGLRKDNLSMADVGYNNNSIRN